MTVTTSQVDELIRNYNPFIGHIVVRSAQVWSNNFPDVPSINAHASNAVFDAVEKIYKRERETVGITITGDKGLGKTHIISRIRQKLQKDNKTLFIYINRYDNLNQIKYQLLQSITYSLKNIGNQKVMQWQEIATALINESRQGNYTPQQYINEFPILLEKHSNRVIDKLTDIILQAKSEMTNPYLVKAILWTLSPEHSNYANLWLSGFELTQTQADEMGLPNPKNEDKEADALSNALQILDIISNYRIPVICFDELDNVEVYDNSFTAAQVVAILTQNLFKNLKRGILLIAMYPDTWNQQIKALPQAEAVIQRLVSEKVDRQPIELKYLSSDQIVILVYQWLINFYDTHQIFPLHPLYPFNEKQLRSLSESKPTIREILKWCADNFVVENIAPSPITDNPVEKYFQQKLTNVETDIDALFENNTAIADALSLGFFSLIGETLEGVTIEAIEEVEASCEDQGYIDFKIIGNQGTVKIGVDIVQQSGNRYIVSALKRLIDYKQFDLTHSCLVRSKPIKPTATKVGERLSQLLKIFNKLGGEWVRLRKEDIKPLLAILFVYYECKNHQLTDKQIVDFMKHNRLAINNPLIQEIISCSSKKEPKNVDTSILRKNITTKSFLRFFACL